MTVEEPRASFFRFFEDLADDNDDQELEAEELEMIEQMEGDNFEVACLIRNKLFANAVQWYTGAAIETLSDELKAMLSEYRSMQGDKPSFSEFMRERGMADFDDDDEFGDEDDEDDEDEDDEEEEEKPKDEL